MSGAEGGQHGGIEAVGLGALAAAAGEVADLARVDDTERLASSVEASQDGAFPAAGSFANDLHGLVGGAYLGEERGTARRIMGKAGGLALEVEIEGGFGDIESGVDERRVHG